MLKLRQKWQKKGKKLKNGNSKLCFIDGKGLIPKKIIEKIDFLRQNWGQTGRKNSKKKFLSLK